MSEQKLPGRLGRIETDHQPGPRILSIRPSCLLPLSASAETKTVAAAVASCRSRSPFVRSPAASRDPFSPSSPPSQSSQTHLPLPPLRRRSTPAQHTQMELRLRAFASPASASTAVSPTPHRRSSSLPVSTNFTRVFVCYSLVCTAARRLVQSYGLHAYRHMVW